MTSFDRFEREIPGLMTELAPAAVPEYFDDMLRLTARSRQRPAWSSLERWLPMGVIARPLRTGSVRWELALLVVLALLATTALIAVIGARPPAVPPPFGLAHNGLVVIATQKGDLASVDLANGAITPIVTDPASDYAPWISRNGLSLLFDRRGSGTSESLFVADIDGTDARELVTAPHEIFGYEWSPDDRRVAVTFNVDRKRTLSIIDVATGGIVALDLAVEPSGALYWRPDGREIVLEGTTVVGGERLFGLYVVGTDGSGLRPILPPLPSNSEYMSPSLAPDGIHLAYHRWRLPDERGRIRIVDVDTGTDIPLTGETDPEVLEEVPTYSPDGSLIAFEQYRDELSGYQMVIHNADGTGTSRAFGHVAPAMTGGAGVTFSPDGRQVLITYRNDSTIWLFDLAEGDGRRMDWPTRVEPVWQRVAARQGPGSP